ncbi:FAD binding domain-containing protein [Labrys monachus]|uniref:Xanthine dehydrogenase YagS FAD-binding subunit n=1 Tax=Labrys monachus TaxID=217067 RepID=A0ABU0FED1_9HYPH|nr:xanthine dehydrogenase family protein subunit M [Labrys monachus]MDQ0392967.1 xanthine dehydrogenase YagS FAD-binding subunit [Labrys monachus]
MRPFLYHHAGTMQDAIAAAAASETRRNMPPTAAGGQFIAGGTTMLDLMKLDVMRPRDLVDINAVPGLDSIRATEAGLHLGALTRMAEAASHTLVVRNYPVLAQSLTLAASAQLRNMASLGGNVLQRTRCPYFRDTSWDACNKRNPGSGCAALEAFNRMHAVLGTSGSCIATYPGDFANALVALEAEIEISGRGGSRTLAFERLHRRPGDRPDIETELAPDEIITGFRVPSAPWFRRSRYLKIRDRESYEFALASAGVALDLGPDGRVRDARIALGGVATVPWRSRPAEAVLAGRRFDEALAEEAAEAAFAEARPAGDNAFKVTLGKRTLVRALIETAAMEI